MNWIKIETHTPDKPEIFALAEILGIDPDAAFGKCFRIWAWADRHSISGNAVSVTDSALDRIAGLPGFAAALREVGWLMGRSGTVSFPNFDRHNGQTAKARALTKDRVQRSRNGESVTDALPDKIREDKSTQSTPIPPKGALDVGEFAFVNGGGLESSRDFAGEAERLWQAYPCKDAKKKAIPAIIKALRKPGITFDKLLPAVQAYARRCQEPNAPNPKYAQGWFNDERWNDARSAVEDRPIPKPTDKML